jgi:hypothetical protein
MSASPLGFLKNCAILFCLFAPSAWMIATIPPLWRDMDAYNQVTQDPLVATYWGHAPAYSYVAKVPLFLGQQWERLRGIAIASPRSESTQLTNSGVWLLIVAQHLTLGGVAFYFICAISKFFWIRLALALSWAGNALFYTFAHSVGSETLSMILMVLVVVRAVRLVRNRCEPRWTDWYAFAIVLFLCVLSRHVNLWLILLLPAAFLISGAQRRASCLFASGDHQKRWLRQMGTRDLRRAMIAIAVGIASLAVADSLVRGLAHKTKFQPPSRIGFTFLWRLHFLKTLEPPTRAALLEKVAARTHSTDARKLIALLGQMHEEGAALEAGPFLQRAIQLLFPPGGAVSWEKLDGALNQMAFAFLLPPTPEHLHVARTEFAGALQMPITEISTYLFEATTYYFTHKDEMPACARLVTFRDASADQIRQLPSQHRYFRLWHGLTYNKALMIWFISLLVFVAAAQRRRTNGRAISAFGIALIAVGLLMLASTCLLGEFIPRYGLPMWQLLLLSFYIFVGRSGDLLANERGV